GQGPGRGPPRHGERRLGAGPGQLLHHRAAEGESRGMTRGLRALPILLLLVACSTARPTPQPTPLAGDPPGRAGSGAATRMVGYADDLVERGEVQEAFRVYERVLRDYPADPASASAL